MTAAFMVVRTGRDALYFQVDGLFALPRAYVAMALLAIPQAMAVLLLLRKLGARAVRVAALVLVAAVVVLFRILAEPGGGLLMTGFFVALPLLFSVLFSLVWLLGGELAEDTTRDAIARVYSRLGAASILGGVAGAALARLLGPLAGPRVLLVLGAVLVAISALCVIAAHRRYPLTRLPDPASRPDRDARGDDGRGDGSAALTSLFRTPHVFLLLAIAMAAALSAIFIEFQFYLGAARTGGDSRAMTVFFANVYLILNAVSLVLQLLVTPRLQSRLGLPASLMVLPLTLFGGAATASLLSSGVARAGLRITEGGLKSGMHRSLWEQAFLLFPGPIRPAAKVLVDGLGARIAEGLAAGALYIWLARFAGHGEPGSAHPTWLAVALVATTALWVGLSHALRRKLARSELALPDEPAWRAPLPDF